MKGRWLSSGGPCPRGAGLLGALRPRGPAPGGAARVLAPDLIGLAAWAAVLAGVRGLAGGDWALIAAGAPVLALYVWRELRGAEGPEGRAR